jgi:hypothetical protein
MTSIITPTVTNITLAGSLAQVSILLLLVLLVLKELSSVAENTRLHLLSKSLNIAILPLIVAFAVVVFSHIAEFLH